MSSPAVPVKDEHENNDIDAVMEDTEPIPPPNPDASASSATMDHEPSQPDAQPATSAAQQSRKDATLREFLSKMDDYAPIVCL